MFSVTLDEAIGMRRAGRLQMAYQLLAVTPALCSEADLSADVAPSCNDVARSPFWYYAKPGVP